jgi:tRNA threonylcarbamoyladenosine biosynthesis protein TsaB
MDCKGLELRPCFSLPPRADAHAIRRFVRILGIETSCGRGSVALVEDQKTVCALSHERANGHGESIQPLIEQILANAGWSTAQLDRVAVGTGPGSFTGLRVGIALAQGISEGLELPLVGVGSLQAMALATPAARAGLRCPVLDARRGELFFALFTPDGTELRSAQVAAGTSALQELGREHPGGVIFLGSGSLLGDLSMLDVFHSPETDLPHARWTALAGASLPPPSGVVPCYVRDAVAVVPRLPPNPLRREPVP